MGAIKKYFKHQFRHKMFRFNYETCSDFYLSCCQSGTSPLPLLLIRGLLFLLCLGILLSSLILTEIYVGPGYWFIYMTSWGLVLITVTSGLAFAVSANIYFKGEPDESNGLPLYIKVYWVFYAITIPIAFFITLFYWIFLSSANEEFAVNFALDICIHAINSVAMFLLLITARQPTNLLHFYVSIIFAIVYVIFSVIHQVSGLKDPFGNRYIYPVLDWDYPNLAMITVAFAAVIIVIIHFIIAMLTVCRDALTRSCRLNDNFVLTT